MRLRSVLSATLLSIAAFGGCHPGADIPIPRLFGHRAAADVRARTSDTDQAALKRKKQPKATVMRRASCGAGIGSCPPQQCCSVDGTCGDGAGFCSGPDCQFQYGPGCDANAMPAGMSTAGIPRLKLGEFPYGGAGIFDCTVPGTIALTFDDG
jgi:hypothetical protein